MRWQCSLCTDQLQKVAGLKIQECFLQGVVQQSSGLFIDTVL